jgi:hypothetical protein
MQDGIELLFRPGLLSREELLEIKSFMEDIKRRNPDER